MINKEALSYLSFFFFPFFLWSQRSTALFYLFIYLFFTAFVKHSLSLWRVKLFKWMRFPKEPCSQRSTQSDIDMLSSWCLSLRTSQVVDGPELRSWVFFPLLLLSNFSLSPRHDLLLLFLVQTPIFLSQLSQNLSRKHLPWSSLEITCLKSGQLRISWLSWKWWRWRGDLERKQGEVRLVLLNLTERLVEDILLFNDL